jgi:hypothetical protein
MKKRWNMLVWIIVGIVGIVVAFSAWGFLVRPSRLVINSEGVHFPTVSGFNLDRQEFEFPRDFGGELNLLFVPFLQPQQEVVNTWIPFAQELEATFPGVIYYELPSIDEMPMLSRTFINEGMRAGIPDPTSRQRTITLYIDLAAFMKAIGAAGKSEVQILLVNRQGDIVWREAGRFTEAKRNSLLKTIQATRSNP